MTWWLSASAEQLREAATCSGCGATDADIDTHLCYDCFCEISTAEQHRINASVAAKYGQFARAAMFLQKAAELESNQSHPGPQTNSDIPF